MSEIKLLDIELFISKNNCLEVKNAKLPSEKTGYDPLSLYSELIFGSYGSRERKNRFGYINLNCKIIHPIVYDMVKTISEETSRIIYRKKKYIVKNNQFVENTSGENGLTFLIENFNNVDFTKFCKKEKAEIARFIEKYKKIIIIDKWLVIPAGYRDINYQDKNSLKIISKVNELYKDILFIISQLSGDKDFDEIFIERVQYKTYQITDWFKKEKLTGKAGIFRGSMMKKRMDFTSRLVLLSSPELEMGEIGIPWHTAMAIFEPIFSYNLFKKNTQVLDDVKQYLETNDFGQDDFDKFVRDIINNPNTIPSSLRDKLTDISKEVVKDQVVIVKRDPVTDRNSYFAAVPKITPGRVAYVNSLQLKPLGGDTFKGSIVVYDKDFKVSIVNVSEFPNKYKLKFLSSSSDRWIYEVQEPIYSLSIDPVTGKIEYSLIKYWHVHTNVNFYSLNNNHSYSKTFDNLIVGENQSVWVYNIQSQNMEKIDILELKKNPHNFAFIKSNIKYSECKLNTNDSNLGYFIGCWIGDGYCDYKDPIRDGLVALTQYDKTIGHKWSDIAESLTNSPVRREFDQNKYANPNNELQIKYYEKRSLIYRFYDREICNYLTTTFGKYSSGKFISDEILEYSNDFIYGLIAGIIDTDGYISDRDFQLTSKSEKLISSIRMILNLRFNISSNIRVIEKLNPSKIKTKYYVLRCNIKNDDYDFWNNVSTYVSKESKIDNLMEILGNLNSSHTYKYYPIEILDTLNTELHDNVKKRFIETSFTSSSAITINNIDIDNLTCSDFAKAILKMQNNCEISIIPATNVTIERYNEPDYINIELDNLPNNLNSSTTGFDLTIDNNQQNFLHSEGIFICNSDGDTVSIVPLFSAEAKQEAREKMLVGTAPNKFNSLANYGKIVYSLWLDTIATIYKITKDPNE